MTASTYQEYLHLDVLLGLQNPESRDAEGDSVVLSEQFFIISHQCCELMLKQVLGDLDAATDSLNSLPTIADVESVTELLHRANRLLEVIVTQTRALDQLPLRHFAEFRPYLGEVSGAESPQFARLETILGGGERPGRLYGALAAALEHHGTSVSRVCRLGAQAGVFHRACELLMDIGNGFWQWKITHVAVASKLLGSRPGTGGTTGTEHLTRHLTLPLPELRLLRGEAHAGLASI
ncbi:tryptophan 2,3-dioxygenase family protein [Streptomyces sp. NPDC050535]|uniref:tryptophan 2,3-dioxygenase family protein n=1 Tax=Streptomyces sp. NPDC050535 TaxID=3365626 RepID=UPI0037B69CAA